ncbi:MAG: c-type cytochrome [Sphingomicrobium sp.]
MRWWNVIKLILLAGLAAVPLALVGAVLFIRSGLFNAGAAAPHTKLTEWITHETMIHSVHRHATKVQAAPGFTPAAVVAGFCAYETHCVACHGAAAVAREQWVSGMEPAPPYLLDINDRFTRPQLFWLVRNGIKMTGMPSWKNSMSDRQIWSVVAWLEASRELPPQTYLRWRAERRCGASAPPAPGPLSIPPPAPAPPTAATGGSAPSSKGVVRP